MVRQLSELITNNYTDLFEISGDYKTGSEDFNVEGLCSTYRTDKIRLTAATEADTDGVYRRRDTIENMSEQPVTVNLLQSKFVLPDGDYEVYTQYNNWQHESKGGWQPLVTGVVSAVESVRTTVGAAPILAIWNRQNSRGIVFHLLPTYSWSISARRCDIGGGRSQVAVSLGPAAKTFELKLAPGESVEFADIIYFEFKNKTDLDCCKLHRYINRIAPRRVMPVIYNTWLSEFDWFTYDSLQKQAELAAQIGAEYFVVDAGWFGEAGNWWSSVGDWEEYRRGAFAGHLKDFSDKVHGLGMKFGLWFEIERATSVSNAVKKHPEYYINYAGQYFVNFAHPEAREFILGILDDRIKRYRIDFIKFDFNADIFEDPDRKAFIGYYQGYVKFIEELKRRHPDLYLENCASGGMRMQLANGLLFDSFWLSDNQCAYEGVRIFKDTMLRMSPQWIEKWAVIRSVQDFGASYSSRDSERIFTTHDAIWDMAGSVRKSWLCGFLTGSPLGISCNLTKISPETLKTLSEHIAKFKKDREFYIGADCKILADTDALTSLQFSHADLSKIKVLTFVKHSTQQYAVLYPTVDPSKTYTVDGKAICGADIERYGIKVDTSQSWKCELAEICEAAD